MKSISDPRTEHESVSEALQDNPRDGRPHTVASSELLQGRRELWIEHGSDMYRLRLTGAGKLYLTK